MMENDPEAWIPLFLLSTVLFPRARMGLRVFEPRYLDMVSRCLREQRDFGICLNAPGGQEGEPETVGTLAHIVDWGSDDGVLLIEVEGRSRFTVLDWRRESPVSEGRPRYWVDEPKLPLDFEHEWLKPILVEILGEDLAENLDASTAGMILAQALPAPAAEKQRLLVLDDPLVRLRRIAQLLRRDG
ncbi:MAG: LON peptidase substrate-binding domain-containing protein [Acidithiobacillus sp.]